ncbi:MAG: apolipoprotein A1/A4/E family protein [Lacibacter sp.]|jgi:septum formation inhibitor MinC
MRTKRLHLLTILVLLLIYTPAFTQNDSNFFNKILSLPDKVFGKIDKQSQKLDHQLALKTEKYLSKLEKNEQKLKRKLWKSDSLKAKEIFGDIQGRYSKLRQQLTHDSLQCESNVYTAHTDSLYTALNFLNTEHVKIHTESYQEYVKSNLKNISKLKNKFNQTDEIKKQLKARQELLKQQLNNTPLANSLAKFKKQTYYYQAQLKEYREALCNPNLMGSKLLEVVRKMPAFQNFFNRNSELASLFALPGSNSSAAFLNNTALQTRVQISQMIQMQFAGTNINPQQFIQNNLTNAQSQLDLIKQRAQDFGVSNSGEEMPDFKPNDQKTKSLKERLVLGTNFQSTSTRAYFPVTADLGFSFGYKLNSKSILGIGGAYKLGLGTGFSNIRLSHQGIGIRSFIEWKIKGNFWICGGYEQNYLTNFQTIQDLNNRALWKQSGLLGISRVLDVKSNFFKKMKVQLLYDFFSKQQLPQTQAILFRIGYNF